MIKLVLVRHGQSAWNLENRFTGWTDVDLSEQGIEEAKAAGKVLKENGYTFLGAQVFIATSNFSRVPTVICTQVNKNAIIYSCALRQYEKRTAVHSTVPI